MKKELCKTENHFYVIEWRTQSLCHVKKHVPDEITANGE